MLFKKHPGVSIFAKSIFIYSKFPQCQDLCKIVKKKNLYSFTLKLTKTKTFASLSERVAQQKILPETVFSKYIETGTLN